jgi:hypothetical protein
MPTSGREARLRGDPHWLHRRFELFETFCLPSVLGQDCGDFTWILYFDSETPSPYRERAESLATHPNIFPILRPDVVPLEDIIDHVRANCATDTTHVITTAFDNDDALARDFVTRLQRGSDGHDRAALNFPLGYIYASGKTYLRHDPSNAFISMIEPIDDLRTVWSAWHTELGRTAPLIQLDDRPAWLQVVHERNVSNRIRGTRVAAAEALGLFAIDVPTRDDESAVAIRAENLMLTPGRRARDYAIRKLKPLLHRLRKP